MSLSSLASRTPKDQRDKRPELEKLEIADPAALLEWLGPDRASVKFRDLEHIKRTRLDFVELIRQWVARVE